MRWYKMSCSQTAHFIFVFTHFNFVLSAWVSILYNIDNMNKKNIAQFPLVSIIIRTMNDLPRIKRLFKVLKQQDYHGKVECIVVDTESKDDTVEYALQQGAKIVKIKQKDFNYPKSLNVGCEVAQGEILISLVGHALPIKNNWLSSGVENFVDPKVAGVYGNVIPHKFPEYPQRTWIECLYYWRGFISYFFRIKRNVRKAGLGILGGTNCAIRKSLWDQHHWNEEWAGGAEDYEWARWALKHDYKIVCDYRFSVYHSHGLNFRQMIKQNNHWREVQKPSKFNQKNLDFRNDLNFSK